MFNHKISSTCWALIILFVCSTVCKVIIMSDMDGEILSGADLTMMPYSYLPTP